MSDRRAVLRPTEPPDEDEGMARMSLLDHLEELRSRILKALAGVGVAFALSTYFGEPLWNAVARPAVDALRELGYPARIIFTTPTEAFATVWVKMPMLASVFLAAPWILYQLWAFISPGLYRRERRWGAPFVLISAGLFLTGGAFGYFVAFRNGLVFLLGIGKHIRMEPMISASDYFALFVEVMVGLGLVFELPVLLFLLTLVGLVTPRFLIRQSRYAIILILVVSAAVTQTPDFFNMLLFAVPMLGLYYLGALASFILVWQRERRGIPIGARVGWVALGAAGTGAVFALARYGRVHVTKRWPFLAR